MSKYYISSPIKYTIKLLKCIILLLILYKYYQKWGEKWSSSGSTMFEEHSCVNIPVELEQLPSKDSFRFWAEFNPIYKKEVFLNSGSIPWLCFNIVLMLFSAIIEQENIHEFLIHVYIWINSSSNWKQALTYCLCFCLSSQRF